MAKAPCKGCVGRFVGCHSTCTKYIEFRKELDKHNKVVAEKKAIERMLARSEYVNKRRV